MMSHHTCDVTSWAHVWKLRFSFFGPGYDSGHASSGSPSTHFFSLYDPSYLGVVLCTTQLRRKGVDRTTWPQRHLHSCFSLMMWLNLAAGKSPQNFLTRQSPLQQSSDDLQQGLPPVEVSLSHTKLPVRMRDGMTTNKPWVWRVGLIPLQDPCFSPHDRRVGQ
jgi:hypothetical protein